jgi:RNA polymerase sigma factor (sigma-70 family)
MDLHSVLLDISKGGESASKAFYYFDERFRRPILKYLMRLSITKSDSEDVIQDVYVKVFKSANQATNFDNAEGWIWSIVKNTLTDHLRKKGRYGARVSVFDDQDMFENIAAPESVELPGVIDECVQRGVEGFFKAMPDRATAIQMFLDGLSIREIATRIGRTDQATTQYLYESRKRLAPYLAMCGEYIRV